MMATLFSFMELSTCSSFSSEAIFCTSLRWCSWRLHWDRGGLQRTVPTSQDQNLSKSFPTQAIAPSYPRPLTLDTSLTACISSGPTPSPGSIVTGRRLTDCPRPAVGAAELELGRGKGFWGQVEGMARRGESQGLGETGAGPARLLGPWGGLRHGWGTQAPPCLRDSGAATSACNRHTSLLSRIWAPQAPVLLARPGTNPPPSPPALGSRASLSGSASRTRLGAAMSFRGKSRRSDAGSWSGPGPLFPARQGCWAGTLFLNQNS